MKVDLDKPIEVTLSDKIKSIQIVNVYIHFDEDNGFLQCAFELETASGKTKHSTLDLRPQRAKKVFEFTDKEWKQLSDKTVDEMLEDPIVKEKIKQVEQDPDCFGIISATIDLGSLARRTDEEYKTPALIVEYRTGDFFKLAIKKCDTMPIYQCLTKVLADYIVERIQAGDLLL